MFISSWIILIVSVLSTFYVAFTKVNEQCTDEMQVFVGEGAGVKGDDGGIPKNEVAPGEKKM